MARGHTAGKGSDDEADCIAALCAGPPRRKQASTKIKKAPVFIAAVESCATLPQRMPRHCKIPKPQMMAMEMISTYFCVAGENREKVAAVFGDDDTDGGGGATSGKPVAPADDEAGVIAEGAARKIVLAAAARNRRAKLRHGRCAGKCVEPAEDPNGEEHPDVREKPGDVAGRSNDAGGDSVSDRRGHAKPHAENLKQAPAAGRPCGAGRGRAFECTRQCAVSRNARNGAIISGRREKASWKWRVRTLFVWRIIAECLRNSICPRRNARAQTRSERGQFS